MMTIKDVISKKGTFDRLINLRRSSFNFNERASLSSVVTSITIVLITVVSGFVDLVFNLLSTD